MPSIVGDKYKYATDVNSGGWSVTDKIFGYLDKAGEIYNKVRFPQPGDPGYDEAQAKLRAANIGMFGLQKPWGLVMLAGGAGLLAWGIWKIAQK